jgi:cyclic pyranopterin phosphate synthase
MKCIYCHNEGNCTHSQLSKEQIESLIVNSYDLGLEQVRITGGEPLIHKDIYDICEMLADKYNLKVGINTNLIEIDKMMYMIEKGWIFRVVVGLDYFDSDISKNSPVGKSSKEILANVLKVKKTGVKTSIATVYNGDYDNLYKLTDWCIKNNIKIKILEEVKDEIADSSSPDYVAMRDKIIEDFNLEKKYDDVLKEWHGYKGDKIAVSFFHSHCRLNECDVCRDMHLRVTSNGKFKQCIQTSEYDVDIFDGDIRENIIKALTNNTNSKIQDQRKERIIQLYEKVD